MTRNTLPYDIPFRFYHQITETGPLTNLINYVHDRGRYVLSDGDNFGVFSCGENDGENDGENTVKLL